MASKSTSATSGEQLYFDIRKMPAAITTVQMEGMEAAFQRDSFGSTRRTALAVLSQSCEQVFSSIDDDRDFAVAMASAHDTIGEYLRQLDAMRETMKAAQLRISVGLCGRDDMEDVYIAARGGANND